MGIGPVAKCTSSPYAVPNSNPNPARFQIMDWRKFPNIGGRRFLLIKVRYPDAKNFEGVKIMVYEGFTNPEDLLRQAGNMLDPHFAEHGIGPIARFAPTDEGWAHAIAFLRSL